MQRLLSGFWALIMVLTLCTCGQKAPTWQEQYDLGVKYLSEGNYEEAVIAFTAVIEIDSKQAEAFVGRGDAYIAAAQMSTEEGAKLSEASRASYENAIADYLSAITLGSPSAEVYSKAADAYLALGDTEAAASILEQGYNDTGEKSLLDRLEALRAGGASDTVTVEGYIIYNPDAYRVEWTQYCDQYLREDEDIHCSINTYGVRFLQPVDITVAGERVTISEASFGFEGTFDEFESSSSISKAMFDHPLRMTGYFDLVRQTEELVGPISIKDGIYYMYCPNGDYAFTMTGYEEIEESDME